MNENIGMLLDMFPDKDPFLLAQSLERNSYSIESTVEDLLFQTSSIGLNQESMPYSQALHSAHQTNAREFASTSLESPIRLVVLTGLPGSGKSTFAKQFGDAGWRVVCQDVMGTRAACEEAVSAALAAGERVVVDRTNIDTTQRAHWLRIARERGIGPSGSVCVHLDTRYHECERRVLARTDHPTLPATAESLNVVRSFRRSQQWPMLAEGFGEVLRVRTDAAARRAACRLMAAAPPGQEAAGGGGGGC